MKRFNLRKNGLLCAGLLTVLLMAVSLVGCANNVNTVSENASQLESMVDNTKEAQDETKTIQETSMVTSEAKSEEQDETLTELQTEEPTQAPTEGETEESTQAPTEDETEEPTQAPTEDETEAPTQAPTEDETKEPTQAPTEEKTEAPTQPEVVEIMTQGMTSDDEYLKDWGMQSLELQNQKRSEAGLPALAWNEELYQQISIRGPEIHESFSHTRPNGERCFTVITMGYRAVGENIACGQRSPAEVTESWFNSQGHRENMLRSTYTSAAVVCYRVQNDPKGYTYYWVTIFHG